jgi:hypothetical protein
MRDDAKRERIIAAWPHYNSAAEVGDALGISASSVRHHANQVGLPPKPVGARAIGDPTYFDTAQDSAAKQAARDGSATLAARCNDLIADMARRGAVAFGDLERHGGDKGLVA